MRMLLTPYIQSDLGILILRPGKEFLPHFRHTSRILISSEPEHLKQLDSGVLPDVSQSLAFEQALVPFLTDPTVILAAGGKSQLEHWVGRKNSCQWHDHEHCHKELVTSEYRGMPIKLCWHHDNKFREWTMLDLDKIVNFNVVEWVLERIRCDLRLSDDHQLSIHEVCLWSIIKSVSDRLPEGVARTVLNLPKEVIPQGEMKEADILPFDDRALPVFTKKAAVAMAGWEQLDKPAIRLSVDPEPAEAFMLRPKFKLWECEKYTKWVKTQNCCCCEKPADDPHHIIGHNMGGMGTKAHDLFTIPLCRGCHNELHADRNAWEQKHGSQIDHLFKFLNRALAIRAILQPGGK